MHGALTFTSAAVVGGLHRLPQQRADGDVHESHAPVRTADAWVTLNLALQDRRVHHRPIPLARHIRAELAY